MSARPDRRTVLRTAALGAATLAAGGLGAGGTVDRAAAAARPPIPPLPPVPPLPLEPPPRVPTVFRSPPLSMFAQPLPRLESRPAGGVLPAARSTHRFHPELSPSPSLGYGGASYLGPTLEARAGEAVTLTVRNDIDDHPLGKDVDSTLHGASERDRTDPHTVLHLHGGVTPPADDGHPDSSYRRGGQQVHRYPLRQEAAALWYHDHGIGITRLNVYAGLAGMFLVRDRHDTGRPGNPLGLPAGEFEVPLVMQEKIFTADGAQSYRTTPIVPEGRWEGGGAGDVGVVNGAVWPEMEVARGLYRLRMINASNFSVWNLSLSNGLRMFVIGNDQGLLDAPVAVNALRVAPAERYDVLVDFGAMAPGETCVLGNDERPPGQAAAIGGRTMPVIMRFRAGAGRGFTGPVPTSLRGGRNQPERLPASPRPTRVRTLTLSQPGELRIPPSIMSLNNLAYTSDDIETPRQGTVERWDFVNSTPDPHPVHVHLVVMRVLERRSLNTAAYRLANPQPPIGTRWTPSPEPFLTGGSASPPAHEAGPKDTVRLDGDSVTRVLIRFPTADELGFDPDASFPAGPERFTGMGHAAHAAPETDGRLQGYMWHCHLLDHEDHDMMLRFRVVA